MLENKIKAHTIRKDKIAGDEKIRKHELSQFESSRSHYTERIEGEEAIKSQVQSKVMEME